MSRLLITGGAGFIGANFVRYWTSARPGDHVVVLDKLTYAGNIASIGQLVTSGLIRFVQGDIGDEPLVSSLLREDHLDTVVHFAAESHVDRSIHGPEAFIDTNVVGTHRLLMAVRRVWIDEHAVEAPLRFHHVSTDEVYGALEPSAPPFTEDNKYAPNSPYAASKAASDHLVRAYHHTYGIPVTTSTCSNNFGPFHFPEKLIPLMLVNCLEGRPLPVYGDGQQVRDWLYVEDHCRGIDAILRRGRVGQVYNLGGNCQRANLDVVHRICESVDDAFALDPAQAHRFPGSPASRGRPCKELVTFVTDRPGHDRRYSVDAGRAAADVGFSPLETFESGLARTVAWYLANEAWWRGVQDGSYRQWLRLQYGNAIP